MSPTESKDCTELRELTSARIQMELDQATSVGDIKNYAFLKQPAASPSPAPAQASHPAPTQPSAPKQQEARLNPKYDWYQNATHVFMTFKVEGNDPDLTKRATIDMQETNLKIAVGETNIQVSLSQPIVVEQSQSYPYPTRLEFRLQKKTQNVNWIGLERGQCTGEVKTISVPQN